MTNAIAGNRLQSFVDRIERLEEEKANLAADIREVKAEAKGEGFDAKVLNEVLRRRKKSKAEVEEMDNLVEIYEHALMFS